MTRVIRPERVPRRFTIGGRALYRDERGAPSRVLILSEAWRDHESGETFRRCSFLDEMGEQYDVKAGCLSLCDENWRPLAETPEHLRTLRGRGVETADTGRGLVYAPEPYRRRVVSAPVMEKFDRIEAVPAEPVTVELSRLSPHQLQQLEEAERLATAARLKDRRGARPLLEGLANDIAEGQTRNVIARGLTERQALEANRQDMAWVDHQAQMQRDMIAAGASPGMVSLALRKEREKWRKASEGGSPPPKNGLDELLRTASIDGAEHRAGERYGEMWQAALASVKISDTEAIGGGGADPEERLVKRIAESARLQQIEAEIQAKVRSPRALPTLRLVAGYGRCVSHFSKGASRAKNVEALKLALEVLAIRWGLK